MSTVNPRYTEIRAKSRRVISRFSCINKITKTLNYVTVPAATVKSGLIIGASYLCSEIVRLTFEFPAGHFGSEPSDWSVSERNLDMVVSRLHTAYIVVRYDDEVNGVL